MSTEPEQLLPRDLLERSSLLGKEYAWRTSDIPAVIDAAEAAGLVSIGGHLMFHVPDKATGECYWVEVNTECELSVALNWPDRVRLGSDVSAFEASGRSITEAMWFAWYVESEESYSNSTMT